MLIGESGSRQNFAALSLCQKALTLAYSLCLFPTSICLCCTLSLISDLLVPPESFCWLSCFLSVLAVPLPTYLLLIPQSLLPESCSPFCGRCHVSFSFFLVPGDSAINKSLSVWIDGSFSFISGACYKAESSGDKETECAVPQSL